MANVKDAETLLTGSVVAVEPTLDYKTKEQDGGLKVTVVTARAGFAVVKLRAGEAGATKPTPGAKVAWLVQQRHWSQGDGSGMSCAFVSVFSPGDLDALASLIRNPKAA